MWVDFLSWHKCIRRNSDVTGEITYFILEFLLSIFFKFLETSSRKLFIYTLIFGGIIYTLLAAVSNFQVYFCILFIFFLHIIYFLFTKKLDATDCEVAEESFFPSGWAFHKKAAFGCSFIHEELPQCRVAGLTWQTFYTRCPSWHSSPRDLCTLLFLNQGFFSLHVRHTEWEFHPPS